MRRLKETNSLGKRNGIVKSVEMMMGRLDISGPILANGNWVRQAWFYQGV